MHPRSLAGPEVRLGGHINPNSARGKFNMFHSISRLFLRWRGPKSITKVDGAWPDLPSASATACSRWMMGNSVYIYIYIYIIYIVYIYISISQNLYSATSRYLLRGAPDPWQPSGKEQS